MTKQKKFIARIIQERESFGWKQEDLAQKIGVSRSQIAKIEAYGAKQLIASAETITKLAAAFKTDCHYLLTGEKRENTTAIAETGLSDDAINSLIAIKNDEPLAGSMEVTAAVNALMSIPDGRYFLCMIYRYLYGDFSRPFVNGSEASFSDIVFPTVSDDVEGMTTVPLNLLRFSILKALEETLETIRAKLPGTSYESECLEYERLRKDFNRKLIESCKFKKED